MSSEAPVHAHVRVVASPNDGSGSGTSTTIDPALQLFVDLLDGAEPRMASRSNDRIANVVALHGALRRKFDAVYASNPSQALPVDFQEPLRLMHLVDPQNPRVWHEMGGTANYGSNVYLVSLPNGSSQSVAIQYS